MKRKFYLLIVVLAFVGLMGSCRGFKSAPPCPAYTSVQVNQAPTI
jgi:hypothetical protein